jgi:hypothetical protein
MSWPPTQGGLKAPSLPLQISDPHHHNNRRKTTKTHNSKPKLATINTKIEEELEAIIEDELIHLRQENECFWLEQEHMAR